MLKQLKNNERGVVFVTVLMIIVVMMVLAISIISMNVSQVTLTEREIKKVQAEIISMGAIAQFYANQLTNSAANFMTYLVPLDGTIFNVTIDLDNSLTNPPTLNIIVTY